MLGTKSPAMIAEYGLKMILWLLAAGLFLCFGICMMGVIREFIEWCRIAKGKKPGDRNSAKFGMLICFGIGILSGIFSVIFSCLAMMGWWS